LGGASTIVPPATQQKLRESLPAVQIVTMPKLGHYPHQEAPEDYLRIVQTFLAR
jgi:pimeloyl-ACP methyl ester carboxylesterase